MENSNQDSGENTSPNNVPPQPKHSFRIVLDLPRSERRLDTVLLNALKTQKQHLNLRNITRTTFKQLFLDKKILIKGQPARPSSAINKGITYIDILGY